MCSLYSFLCLLNKCKVSISYSLLNMYSEGSKWHLFCRSLRTEKEIRKQKKKPNSLPFKTC